MIPRYSREVMARIWSEENKFDSWLKVELAACEALADMGLIPQEAAARMVSQAKCDVECIHAIEEKTHHDVAAFVDLSGAELADVFNAKHHLRHLDTIFKRVFEEGEG